MAHSWVEGPYPLISAAKFGVEKGQIVTGAKGVACEMTIVHNCLIRGVNAIRNQVVNVAHKGSPQDKLDFANFSYLWAQMLIEHHDGEEEIVFPKLESRVGVPDLMKPNVDEHKAFHEEVVIFMEYTDNVRTGKEDLDAEKLTKIIDAFMTTLNEHLHHEIDTLLALDQHADRLDIEAWWQECVSALSSKVLSTAERRSNILPLTFIFHDRTFEDGVWEDFPPVPYVVKLAFKWLFMGTRASWWRFAPCDYDSNPKELPFV